MSDPMTDQERLIKCVFLRLGERMWVEILEGDETSGRGMLRNDSFVDPRLRVGVAVTWDTLPDGTRSAEALPTIGDKSARERGEKPIDVRKQSREDDAGSAPERAP